jgi:hypothetical protein
MKMLSTFVPAVAVALAVGGAIAYVQTSVPSRPEPTAKVVAADTQAQGWSNGPTSSVYGQSANPEGSQK